MEMRQRAKSIMGTMDRIREANRATMTRTLMIKGVRLLYQRMNLMVTAMERKLLARRKRLIITITCRE